ncbi:MAG: T9SS type A sorting domain-containing protein [bacterium]|nr:T9SS type A sorting domain-containing protein [bacterium]
MGKYLFLIFFIIFDLQGASFTITDSVIAHTQDYIGTVEGGHFNINDLLDCGINSLRLYGDMSRLEPEDDDKIYGIPCVDSIKADSFSSFSSLIPWAVWDSILTDSIYWGTGISFDKILKECSMNTIELVLGLRPIDIFGKPDWAPRFPYDQSDWNEWWEYCFAVTYWCNVQHDYKISHFQIHNEPDVLSQGWDGTFEEYVNLVKYGADAIRFASRFSETKPYIHSPVVAQEGSQYMSYTLQYADSFVDIVDYHNYSNNQTNAAKTVNSMVFNYNNDGIVEPIWNSEWGTYSESYNSLSMALTTANNLFDFSLLDTSIGTHCTGTNQFLMWDWGELDGLVNTDGSKNETYYAFRLCCRGMQGKKEILRNDYNSNGRVMVTRDSSAVYIIALEIKDTLFVNAAQIGIGSGTGEYYVYDKAYKDSLVNSIVINNGIFKFFCPDSALVCVKIDRKYGIESQVEDYNLPVLNIYISPFSKSVQYQVVKKGIVSLKLYDMSGRMVRFLVSEDKEPGYYIVKLDGERLQNGVYFVRLVAGNYKEVKKLILMK